MGFSGTVLSKNGSFWKYFGHPEGSSFIRWTSKAEEESTDLDINHDHAGVLTWSDKMELAAIRYSNGHVCNVCVLRFGHT